MHGHWTAKKTHPADIFERSPERNVIKAVDIWNLYPILKRDNCGPDSRRCPAVTAALTGFLHPAYNIQ
jgi:hypothetical protein